MLLYLDKLLLKIVRNLIYLFKIKYKKDLTDRNLNIIFFIYFFIINILLGPLKFFLGFFYSALRSIIEFPFSLFLFMRLIGFVFSILILSDLFIYIYNKLGFLIFFLHFYLLFIIISIIVKYIDRDLKYLKIQYMNNFIKTDYLIFLRNYSTLFGLILLIINEDALIEKKYIDITSSYLKTELEEGFYKY